MPAPTSTASFPSAGGGSPSGGAPPRRPRASSAIATSTSAIAASGTRRISSAERSWPLGLTPKPRSLHSWLESAKPRSDESPLSTASCFWLKRSRRASETRPFSYPSAVSRASALSARSRSRYSAREVNIRYGSIVPRLTRSSTRTPM